MEFPRRNGIYQRTANGERAGGAFAVAILVVAAWIALASSFGKKAETPEILGQPKNIEKVKE